MTGAKSATEHALEAMKGFSLGRGAWGDLLAPTRLPELPAIDLSAMRFPANEVADYTLAAASRSVKVLAQQIQEFESQLDDSQVIAFWIVGGPAGKMFVPQQIVAENPDKIIFKGRDIDHHPFVLVQHVTQLNFVIKVAPLEKGEKRQPIGFHIPEPR
jgi:hypothetical protein